MNLINYKLDKFLELLKEYFFIALNVLDYNSIYL